MWICILVSPHLDIEMAPETYVSIKRIFRDLRFPIYEDNLVSQPSYLYNGNSYTGK